MSFRSLPGTAALTLAALALVATSAHAGPPWISVELPANPHDARTRGALLVVHTYHHATAMEQSITCALEGLVNGARRTVACEAGGTTRPGVYAIRGTVPREGIWMLVVTGREEHATATVLVDLARGGDVVGVRVPTRQAEGGRWSVPIPVSPEDVDAALRARASALSRAETPGPTPALAGLGIVALAGLSLVLRRRG